jgi:hypothetical protein
MFARSNGLDNSMGKVRSLLDRCWRAITTETATARGRALLKDWLSPEQRAQFEATKSFEVVGCHTGKRYCIEYGEAANVFEIDEAGCPVMGWCFLPKGGLVAGDVMLAQKIALENDERAALLVARRFLVNIRRRRHVATLRRRFY